MFFISYGFHRYKDPDTFRIFVLGGSTVQGRPYAVSDTKSTLRILSLFSIWPESGRRVLRHLSFEYPLRGHRIGNRRD